MTIINLLNQIRNDEIVLPAIQRDFVWPEERVVRLLDSIMRGYPIGIALLWETYLNIQYRKFAAAFRPGQLHDFFDNTRRTKRKLVLDGQQRLQSLYIALYGTYAGKCLYFDVLSGEDSDDVEEEKYDFEFMDKDAFNSWKSQLSTGTARSANDGTPKYFVKVADLFKAGVRERNSMVKTIAQDLALSSEVTERVAINLARFDEVLTKNTNILKVSVVDEDLPSENPERKSEADVVEIFVRVNREGTPLSRSDLIFSMLKLNWRESAESLPEFVRQVNEGNSFELDTDFVIRCLFAVSGLGTKFELDLLRNKKNIELLRNAFPGCCDAVRSVVDTVVRDCWCASTVLIGGHSTLVPFVYYLFHTPKHEVPKAEIASFRKAFYLFALARPFSRYADSRLWKFIRQELRPLVDREDFRFPFERAVWWVKYWENYAGLDGRLLQANVALTLHLLQQYSGAKVKYPRNSPELDHIFPRSVLRQKGFEEAEINHFANFWILAKGKNQNKSNRHPADYFADVEDAELKRARIDRELLDYRRFRTFLNERSERILEAVRERVQFTDEDFADRTLEAVFGQ